MIHQTVRYHHLQACLLQLTNLTLYLTKLWTTFPSIIDKIRRCFTVMFCSPIETSVSFRIVIMFCISAWTLLINSGVSFLKISLTGRQSDVEEGFGLLHTIISFWSFIPVNLIGTKETMNREESSASSWVICLYALYPVDPSIPYLYINVKFINAWRGVWKSSETYSLKNLSHVMSNKSCNSMLHSVSDTLMLFGYVFSSLAKSCSS